MADVINADICVIGAGSGGLSVAAGAAQLGVRTVLVEHGKMGGDCLNYGCVPSKALLAAARQAATLRRGAALGIADVEPEVDFPRVNDHVRGVIDSIAPMDSQERFEGLGCTVIREHARFMDDRTLEAGTRQVRARRFVIATGSTANIPPILGLDRLPYFTNETIFDNRVLPGHLLIIGGGPIGMEMAQAHRRLGSEVTVIEAMRALPRDDPELTAILKSRMEAEGITLHEGTFVDEARGEAGAVELVLDRQGHRRIVHGTHILVAAGRLPTIEDLGLEAAGVRFTPRGINVDRRLRTSNKRIFAIGDVTGGLQFTHVANEHAGLVVRNALFRVPARFNPDAIPWVTYTDPELAHVGLYEDEARRKYSGVRTTKWDYLENDRARAERKTDGLIKVVTARGGKIVGASIVGESAGLIIQPWVLAISRGMKMSAMASHVAPYPTLGEISKRVAGAYYTPALFSPRTRKLVSMLARLG